MRALPNLVLLILLGLIPFASLSAAPAKDRKSSKPSASDKAGKTPASRSTEDLMEEARPAVVVIRQLGRDGTVDGVGTGFIIDASGLVATSFHVIGEARSLVVMQAGGRQLDVVAVHAWDRVRDLAILKVNAKDLPALKIGDSDELRQGAPVVAVGNPRGLEHSVVQGVVSAFREMDNGRMIQLAIPIEPGNSGGPLLNARGEVCGILTLKSLVTENLGFATPINALKPLLQQPNTVPMDSWLAIGALDPAEWQPQMGARWFQRGGIVKVEGTGSGFGGRSVCLNSKSVPEGSYELSVSVRLDDESGAAGLIFGGDEDGAHFGFYPTAGQMRLTQFKGPDVYSWNILKQSKARRYRAGEWNDLRVQVTPTGVQCFVNGDLTFESAEKVTANGKVGLAKFRQTKAAFKGFSIRDLRPGEAPAKEIPPALIKSFEDGSNPALAVDMDSTLVREALMNRARELDSSAALLRKRAGLIHTSEVLHQLTETLEKPGGDLVGAALLVAKLDNEELDVRHYQREVEMLAAHCRKKISGVPTAEGRLDGLIQFMFQENGFHGSRSDYYNRSNSYLNDVLDDREGIPITLSVLFMELARKSGFPETRGIPLPGHFMVEVRGEGLKPGIVDAYDSGRRLSRDEAGRVAAGETDLVITEQSFKPATDREIIIRMLRNLMSIASRDGESQRLLRYLEVYLTLEPTDAAERFRRAMLRSQSGDSTGAKSDITWLLEHRPKGLDVERLEELMRSL